MSKLVAPPTKTNSSRVEQRSSKPEVVGSNPTLSEDDGFALPQAEAPFGLWLASDSDAPKILGAKAHSLLAFPNKDVAQGPDPRSGSDNIWGACGFDEAK